MKNSLRFLFITISLLSTLSVLLFNSCNIINPSEQIPAYIKIDSATVHTNAAEGTSSQKISDAWVYADGGLQGVFEIPVTFPLLKAGTKDVIVAAGISENGVAGTRVIYPFFYPDTLTVNLEPKQTYLFNPKFRYRDGTLFQLNEDFESGNSFVKLSGDTTMIRVNDANVFEGNFCGWIKVGDSLAFAESKSSTVFPFANDGTPVYIEMNYKCNHEFRVGVIAHTSSSDVKYYQWNITPHDDWNKIYLHLNDLLQSLSATSFNIVIEVIRNEGETDAEVFLDNIKLVTFQ